MKKRQSKTHLRETIGQTVYDNLHKQPDVTDMFEITPDMQERYWKDLTSIVVSAKDELKESFYIEMIFIREKALQGYVLHPRLFARTSCPTATYGQHVWHYNYSLDQLAFIWMLPFKDRADHLRENMLNLSDGEKSMYKYVLDFDDGTLERVARDLNKEDDTTANLILINNEKAIS
jgi:hypothetical protein